MTDFDDDSQSGAEKAAAAASPYKRELIDLTKLGSQFGKVLSSAFDGLTSKGKSFGDVLRGIGQSLSKFLVNAAFKTLGQLFSQAIGSAFSGAASGSGVAFAKGGVLSRGTPIPFASGGIVSSPVTFPLGRGLGIAGERGAEAILPLARGPDGRLGVAATGAGGGVHVTFNVTTPDAESFRRSETQIAALLARTVGRGQRNL